MNFKKISIISLISIFILSYNSTFALPIKGKLVGSNPQNLKVIGVNKNTQTVIATVNSLGKFTIPKPKKGMTLHLVNTSGTYYGPIVAAKGAKAYAALNGEGGKLKAILKSTFGAVNYTKHAAIYTKGGAVSYNSTTGPKGAGKFGFVTTESVANNGISIKVAQEGVDTDKDGIPDVLDIDDDGDLRLDVVDEVAHVNPPLAGESYSTLRLDLVDSLNVNSGGLSDSLIDSLISEHLILKINLRDNSSGKTISAANVDCGELSYCNGSTGTATLRMSPGPLSEGDPWINYDTDSDGLPNLYLEDESISTIPATIGVKPRATRSQIRTGDSLFIKATFESGPPQTIPVLVPFIFNTGPALKSIDSGGGTTTITYPLSLGDTGTQVSTPFVLSSSSVTMVFWRPQRSAIEGAETSGTYYDMGGLSYGVSLAVGSSVYNCNSDEYSGLSSTLSVRDDANGTKILRDSALDVEADTDKTLQYTIDIGACLSRQGVSTSGTDVLLALEAATDKNDSTSQFIYMQLP